MNLSRSQILILENIRSDVKSLISDDFSGHDYLHCERVMNNAYALQKSEGGDLFIILVAALLHDVDDVKISPETYCDKINAHNILRKYAFNESDISGIISIIDSVSFSRGVTPETIEGKIVQDADRLDALGAIGIARCFAYSGNKNLPIYTADDLMDKPHQSQSALMHFYDKLLYLSSLMNTQSGKRTAEQRTMFIKKFLKQLYKEIDYKDI